MTGTDPMDDMCACMDSDPCDGATDPCDDEVLGRELLEESDLF